MIYVDADACPVKDEVVRVAERHAAPVVFVANGGLRPRAHPLVSIQVVAEGPDAADRWIAERIGPGDVCVTADVPLAARCIAVGARALGHDGTAFRRRAGGPRGCASRSPRGIRGAARGARPRPRRC
ncbi:MAG: DUF188 domain-containing protein, partial [Rhodobacteraceae bacterium]|nr:DUF188 domain-containing protein [Paracoccaceae bacterium]